MTHSASASHTVSGVKADLLCAWQVTELRTLIATAGGLPVDRLKLLLKGKPLQDGDKAKGLQHDGRTHMQLVKSASLVPTMHLKLALRLASSCGGGCADTIVVVVAPLTPTAEVSDIASGTGPANEEDEDDDVDRFR